MTAIGARADAIYRRIGNKGITLIIFMISVALHTVVALETELLSVDPNEFIVASYSALYSGGNWSGVVSKIGYFYGYVQSLLYTPVMLFGGDPIVQYKAMLIINGIVISFVPVIAFKIAGKLGVEKAWQKVIIALSCGFYSTYIAHTKFIWNETVCIILPWLMIFLMFKINETNGRVKRHLLSILAGFMFALSFAAHERLLAVVIAAVAVAIVARIGFRKKMLCFSSFIPSFAAFMVLERLVTAAIKQALWLSSSVVLNNTIEKGLDNFSNALSQDYTLQFFQTLFGHLYYFITSTWGIGGLAIYLFVVILGNIFSMKKKRLISVFKSEYSIFYIYSMLAVFGTMLLSVLNNYSDKDAGVYQDTLIFGRYMDSVIPFTVLLVLSFIFIYGIDFTRLLGGVISAGMVDLGFFLFTEPVLTQTDKIRISPILGLYPIRIGQSIDSVLDGNSLMLTVSVVFSVIAVFIVVVCCAKKYRSHILSVIICGLMIYSAAITSAVYIPYCASETKALNQPVYDIAESVYNQPDAPKLTVYKTSRRAAALVQFLKQRTEILYTKNRADITENCFILTGAEEALILPNAQLVVDPEYDDETESADLPVIAAFPGTEDDSKIPLKLLASTEEYKLYAYGEKAVAYAQSQD